MAVKVKLFGVLKDKAPDLDRTGTVGILMVEEGKVKNINDILVMLNLKEEETSHLFLNNDYSGPMRIVSDGDTVAIFPRDMALLYKWYFTRKQ
jgi:molybdopterin converting factor small subunit